MITRRTLTEFRENLVSCFVLRDIHDFFRDEGFERDPAHEPTDVQGQRRELVEQYYAGIDLKSANDVKRLLAVFADILRQNESVPGPNCAKQSYTLYGGDCRSGQSSRDRSFACTD